MRLRSISFFCFLLFFLTDLWHDHCYPLHDTFLGFLWGYYQLFCDPDFTRAEGLSIFFLIDVFMKLRLGLYFNI
jgi:hypothetical protein